MSTAPIPQPIKEQLKIVKSAAADPIQFVRMDSVQAEAVEWLWEPFIARKKLTAITGEEGIGKSWIVCMLAAIVSNGWNFPHTKEPVDPGNVILCSSEDGLSDTLKPRLTSMGADQSRIFTAPNHFYFDEKGLISFRAFVSEISPSMVIIDPFFSYLNAGLNINLATEIRPITSKLAAIAEDHNAAFSLVRHVGKAKGMGDPRSAGLGSIDFRAVCRSELLVGRDPDNRTEGAIVQIKNNLGEFGKAVGYKIHDGRFEFQETNLTAQRILSSARSEDDRAESDEAVDFLRNALCEGEGEAMKIKKSAAQLGITDHALRRARARLGVEVFRRGNAFGRNQRWYWRLKQGDGIGPSPTGPEVRDVEIDF
jgi:DNA repair protein RadA/Sms